MASLFACENIAWTSCAGFIWICTVLASVCKMGMNTRIARCQQGLFAVGLVSPARQVVYELEAGLPHN